MKIKNYSYADYLGLRYEEQKEINFNLKFGVFEPLDLFQLGNFIDLSFGFVKDIQEIFFTTGLTFETLIDEISKLKNIDKKEVASNSIYKLHRCRLYIRDQNLSISKLESQLSHAPTAKEEAAGIDEFSKYRSFIQLDSLAGGDVTKYEVIRTIEYGTCFTKLLLAKDTSDYNEKYLSLK